MLAIKKIKQFIGHRNSIYILEKGSEPHLFFSGSGDGLVVEWNLIEDDDPIAIAKNPNQVFSLHHIPEKNLLFIGEMQGGIHVIDLASKKEIHYLLYHQKAIFDLQANDNLLFAASGDGSVSIWSLDNFKLVKQILLSEQNIRSIDFHPNKKEMAVACSDNLIYIIDLKKNQVRQKLSANKNSIFSVKYSPDGKILLSGSRDAHLNIWEVEKNYELRQTFPAHLFTINHIVYSPDGKLFATASRDKTIKIWDSENFKLLKVIDKEKLEGHKNSVNKLLWTNYHNYLISCSDDRAIMVWEIKERE